MRCVQRHSTVHLLRGTVHHAQHGRAAGAEKAGDEDSSQRKEDDVQNCCVVPLDSGCNGHDGAVLFLTGSSVHFYTANGVFTRF